MFTYQKDTKSLFVAECSKKDFWREIRKSSTAFNIDTRREIMRAVDAQDEATLIKWAEHVDYQKFDAKMLRSLKTKTGKEKWQKKPLDKKLLAWADDLKKSLTAFQFCCYQFDEATVKGKKGVVYEQRHGICLETQHYPDSPNKPEWPSVVLRPGETYHSHCIFSFIVKED